MKVPILIHAYRAFTLIELLCVLSIISIMALFAIPSYTSVTSAIELKQVQHQLRHDLLVARDLAKRTSQHFVVVPYRYSDSELDWSEGWKIFADTNHNAHYEQGELLVKSYRLPLHVAMTWNRQSPIVFRGNGFSHTPGSFSLCGQNEHAYKVVLSMAGVTRVEKEFVQCG